MTKAKEKHLPISLKISFRQVADNLIAAFESGHYGAMYWCHGKKYIGALKAPTKAIWYDTEELLEQSGPIFQIQYDDPEHEEGNNKGRKNITRQAIQKGLQLMAEKSPKIFASILLDEADAADADIMLQYIVLGDIIYG